MWMWMWMWMYVCVCVCECVCVWCSHAGESGDTWDIKQSTDNAGEGFGVNV